MDNSLCISLLCFVIFGSFSLGAQSVPAVVTELPTYLPALTPSHSEDFSHLRSNPSLCTQNVFFDANGKMWINTCDELERLKVSLFQFDGYDFRLVRGDLKKIKGEAFIQAMLNKRKLIGISQYQGQDNIFLYDLFTNEVSIHSPPEKGHIRQMDVMDTEQVFFLLHTENRVIKYEMTDTQFIQRAIIPPEYEQITVDGISQQEQIRFFDNNNIWIIAKDVSCVERIHLETGERKKYNIEKHNAHLSVSDVSSELIDFELTNFNGIIYLQFLMLGRRYFYQANESGDEFRRVGEGVLSNRMLIPDKNGNMLYVYSDRQKKYYAILQDKTGSLFNYSSFFQPLNGHRLRNVISTDFMQQVAICSSKGVLLHTVKAPHLIKTFLENRAHRAIVELPDQKYMVTPEHHNTYIIDGKTGKTSVFSYPEWKAQNRALVRDSNGYIWAASRIAGLIKYDPVAHTFQEYSMQGRKTGTLFTFVGSHTLAVTIKRALYLYDLESDTLFPFLADGDLLTFPKGIQDMVYGKNDLLWVATTTGLYRIDIKNRTFKILGKEAPFQDAGFLCINEDEQGRLWLGTSLNGLQIYDPLAQKIQTLNSDNGLANNTVPSITTDDEGVRWLGTFNGVSLVSPEGSLITNLYKADGLAHNESNRHANLKTSDGNIMIGTVGGISFFNTKRIKENLNQKQDLKIYLTSLEYYDSHLYKLKKKQHGLSTTEAIELPAEYRDLTVRFAVSNYFRPEENKYAYRIEGIDDGWRDLGNQRRLRLNNLPAGNFRLLIKGSDALNNWTKEPIAITIRVNEFFYKQGWFFALCVLLAGGLIALWINSLRRQVKRATGKIRKDKVIIEKQAEKLRELDEAKSEFFTNISHEFRTPLTIISGMVEQVRDKPEAWLDKGTQMIKQNTHHLLDLINQILDLRKLDSKHLTLNLVQGDIVKHLEYIINAYHSHADSLGLKLHFLATQSSIIMDYDPDKILRIVSNLLSNAIKYNKEQGDIYCQVQQVEHNGQDVLQLHVRDTGTGIPEEKLPAIFNRFYQINTSGSKKTTGSGIGLALVHALVELMKGAIEVNSEIDVGTTFLIKIPITRNAKLTDVDMEVPVARPEWQVGSATALSVQEDIVMHDMQKDVDLPNVLIVEDNSEIVQLMVADLQDHYHLYIANNGQEGIDKAIQEIPDIIISDVMMPEKNGYELTQTLKNDERTSHIPIILLTAKADIDSKIKGLERGADAYLAKPFYRRELHVRLKQLLALREKLQQRYSGQTDPQFVPLADDPQNPVFEDAFIQKVYTSIAANISDPQYGILRLTRDLGMSRSQVFRKIKALTGTSPALFIRSYRLREGKKLLTTTDLTISEIAYDVGFSSLQYFSDAFMEEFGIRPSATRK